MNKTPAPDSGLVLFIVFKIVLSILGFCSSFAGYYFLQVVIVLIDAWLGKRKRPLPGENT